VLGYRRSGKEGAGAYLGAGEMEQTFSALARFGPKVPRV